MRNRERRIYYLWATFVTVAFVFIMAAKVAGLIAWKLYDLIGVPSAVFLLIILYSKIINDD